MMVLNIIYGIVGICLILLFLTIIVVAWNTAKADRERSDRQEQRSIEREKRDEERSQELHELQMKMARK
jgi:flagellar biosynthesis component FlhA